MNNLNMMCPIGGTGYGITSLNIFKKLYTLNHNISLFPIGNNISYNAEHEKEILQRCLQNNQTFDSNAPCLKIWHQNDLATRIGSGKYFVFPFFELDKLTQLEVHHLNSTDELFVTSEWGKRILIQNGVTRHITVAPLGVDMDIFQSPLKIKIENPNYIFMHIGKWERRKSHDFLIQAFNLAFDVNDNVELWLMPYNPFLNQQQEAHWISLAQNCKLASKIKIFNRVDTQYQLAEFIYHTDCGVFLSRAEGWNNEIVETMALNKPIIATNYSAHTEYCTKDNSYLVDITETEPAFDDKWFKGEGNWAKLDKDQLDQTIFHMRSVYSNNIKTNPNGLETAKKYNWTNTAQIISSQIFKTDYHANTKKKRRRK